MIKLKNILGEGYAWERQDGKPLPTLKDVQEAYDAKGVEDAVEEAAEGAKPDYIDADGDGNEEESMKKAFADKEAEDDDYDNDHSDPLIDEEETDMDVLNMGSLEEGFWNRVKGNLHGHEYILREAFRK
jgi:DNA-directed RNA polymerase delta subunit